MPEIVFVYGTLKRGFPNHAFLANAAFLGEATTAERYPMVVQGRFFSPAVIPEPGQGERVRGELWQVDAATLARLDELESVHLPSGYIREKIKVEPIAGARITEAWVYFKPRERVTVIHSEPHADYQDRRYVPQAERND